MNNMPRHWVVTASGKMFDFDAPAAHMVDLKAIATQLTELPRWSGNLLFTYPVSHHSLIVAANIPKPEWRIYGLLHDGAEFVTGDLVTPFKGWLTFQGADVHGLERRILEVIWEHFGLPRPTAEIAAAVDLADARALATEYRDVVAGKVDAWQPTGKPFSKPVTYKHPMAVHDEFIEMAEAYLNIAHAKGLRRAA